MENPIRGGIRRPAVIAARPEKPAFGKWSERMEFVPDRIIRNTGDLGAFHKAIDEPAVSLRD